MACIVDQQVVTLGQLGSKPVDGAKDVFAGRVMQQRHGEAVFGPEQVGRCRCVIDGRLELGQVPVFVVSDDECVVAAKFNSLNRKTRARRVGKEVHDRGGDQKCSHD